MTTLILILLSILAIILIFFATVLGIELLDRLRELIKAAALDYLQFVASLQSIRLDNEERQNKIELQSDYARSQIVQNRQRMLK